MPHPITAAAGESRTGRPAAATLTLRPGGAGRVMPLWQALDHPLPTDPAKSGVRP